MLITADDLPELNDHIANHVKIRVDACRYCSFVKKMAESDSATNLSLSALMPPPTFRGNAQYATMQSFCEARPDGKHEWALVTGKGGVCLYCFARLTNRTGGEND